MIRKLSLGLALFLVICGIFYFRGHRRKGPPETGYAANRQVIVWNTTAQVRAPASTVKFGDRLQILDRLGNQVQVRTAAGIIGWVSRDDLLSAEFWKKTQGLEAEAGALPVEARGHTHVLSNLHLDPGRDSPRIRQLNKDIPVDLIERRVAAIPQSGVTAVASAQTAAQASAPTPQGPADDQAEGSYAPAATSDVKTGVKKEDWWLVRAHLADETTVSGWVLGKFIDLDVPSPLPDYASSAGMRIVAWFELNRVAVPGADAKPQYLLVGTHGSEGQPCDFMLLRVYTWSSERQRYETAYVESSVCGKLPITITPVGTSGNDLTFAFEDTSLGAREQRVYRMQRTIVRRVKQSDAVTKVGHRER